MKKKYVVVYGTYLKIREVALIHAHTPNEAKDIFIRDTNRDIYISKDLTVHEVTDQEFDWYYYYH